MEESSKGVIWLAMGLGWVKILFLDEAQTFTTNLGATV